MTVVENNLGNGTEAIEFFSKEVDYDQKFFEAQALKKKEANKDKESNKVTHRLIRVKDLIRIWEEGGPVKILCLPNSDVYPLYFKNYQNLGYDGMKEVLGKTFLTIYELENRDVRVTYRNENDLRTVYKILKQDKRYNVKIKLDVKGYHKNNCSDVNGGNKKFSNRKKDKSLISRWLNNVDVMIETSKQNNFPIQINNYQRLRYNELMQLFSKYGKFFSITNLGNGCVQVKYCNEDAARECYKDLIHDRHYNVRLLFFLKELNTLSKKIVKEVLPVNEKEHLSRLLHAEECIKFCSNKSPSLNGNHFKKENISQRKKENALKKLEYCENGKEFVVKKNHDCFSNHSDIIYVEGTPLHNQYLKPPRSYTIWKYNKINLPLPSIIDEQTEETDLNYEYFLKGKNCNPKRHGTLE